jgi:RecB family exonuclease
MLQNNILTIYATSRAIREELKESLKSNQILSKVMSIGEFEKKILLVPNRVFIDEDTRVLLLKEASDFSTFKDLQIDREFFAFLKNSKFLFAFFDELAVEKVEIERLFEVDMYASYLEHLEILSTLKKRYIALLDEHNYCDKMILPKVYQINSSFISSFEKIELFLEGYLNNFEFELLKKISKITTLIIDLHTNDNNQKMIDRFEDFGFLLDKDMHYKLDISNNKIIKKEKKDSYQPIYKTFSSNSKILQSAFIKKSVYDFLKAGLAPEDIVVVLPDSSFANLLSVMDDENNFNFAMGKSFTQTSIYKDISALYDYSQDLNLENRYRLARLGYDREKIEDILKRWSKVLSKDELMVEFDFVKDRDEREVEIYKKELHLFSKLFPTFTHYRFTNIVHLFLNRLKSCTIDDVSGGKITVMEPLETRGVGFDGVIVVDFNDSFVPSRNQKDMFLSSDVRSLANLPISKDRENLQKYYYKRLFQRAKYVNISYVLDEQNSPTRFIDELGIKSEFHDKRVEDYHDILFAPTIQKEHFIQEDLNLEYDFTKVELSSTSLKCYLDCKRKYYYKYIRKLEEAKIPKEESDERIIGIYIHDALKEFYKDKKTVNDSDELYLFLQKELYLKSEKDLVLRFYIDMWLERLRVFSKNEVKYFSEGFNVYGCEMSLKTSYCGINLSGKIDRVDIKDGEFYVLDYKSGKIPKTTKKSLPLESDFQLQFYHLLVSTLGEVRDASYYDLKNALFVEDKFFDEKMLLLEEKLEILKDKNQNFTMSEDINKCKYCPYIKLCDRGS